MKQYCAIIVFVFFLLKPLLGFAESSDPFDNTILTFEENIESTEPVAQVESFFENMDNNMEEGKASVALDQPINKRYKINRYSMQGVISSENKTQMLFLALDENVKFYLSMNDCLGLDCAYITHIDKKGRVTFEDELGVYRFQVGQGSYMVERKGLIARDGIISTDVAQQIADGTCIGNIPEEIEETCQCITFNLWASFSPEDLNQFNLDLGTAFIKEVYGEEPDEQLEFMGKYAQAVGTDPLPSGAEIPVITEEQAFRGAKGLTTAIINNKNFQEASLYCQEALDITENEATDWMLTDEYIKASSYTAFPGLEIGESSDDAMEEIASESGLLLDDTVDLENLLQDLESENLSLRSEIEVLSNSNIVLSEDIVSLNEQINELTTASQNLQETSDSDIVQELQGTIAAQEQALNQQQESIDLLQEELQKSSADSDVATSSGNQNLQDTIASLNSELNSKSSALGDAENKLAIQEKQIDTLKNDLDAILSKSGTAVSDMVQELQGTIAAQEQALNQQQESIDLLQEELQNWVNSAADTDTVASNDDADAQNLQDTIASLNSELDSKSSALGDAENKLAIQEKQIDALKNDLDTVLKDFNKKLNAKQQMINDLKSQLLLAQSTESTAPTNGIEGNNLMVAREDVNIRENPSPDSSIVGVLLKDSKFSAEDTVQGWYKIILQGGKEGYVYSPLDSKSSALGDAENKLAIQEKQIDTLKNDLDTVLKDFNKKLNAKQQMINDLKSQLLLAQSTAEPASTDQSTESAATESTAEPASTDQSTESAATESTAEPASTDQSTESAATESTAPTNGIEGNNLMVAREDVNIRENPSPDSSIVGVLLKDKIVNVENTVQGWYKIIIEGGKEGYVYSPMLKKNN